MKIFRIVIKMTLCLILLYSVTSNISFADKKVKYDKELLVIQSYQRDYEHTRALENGIYDTFNNSHYNVKINYEFLDSKRDIGNYNFELMSDIMTKKYSDVLIDGVILCDDDALKFYINYGKSICPNADKIVATGINSIQDYSGDIQNIHIIEEFPDVQKTIQVALEQNRKKDIKKLNFIYDVTTTSTLMKNKVEKLIKNNYQNYQTEHYTDRTPLELKYIIDNAQEDELFFLVLYSRDRNGISYYYDEVPKFIAQNSKNPIYSLWEFYMGTGVMGGYVASSYLYGQDAANMMQMIWDGKTVPKYQSENGKHQKYIFDYNVLIRYGIKQLPKDVSIINKPVSYWEENKIIITIFSLICLVLITIIVLLVFIIRQKRSIFLKNKEIVKLNQDIIETQKNLIERLGDVIETRSHETASHVKRVAEISRFLALKYGLSEQEACILATISPMHDVGKIGIPEGILHKPGKLTDKEFDIIKRHTNIGYEILKSSEKEILYHAAIIALEHHERWDGKGYPNGIYENNIHIFARITAIADVYDAIRSNRVYKEAWSFNKSKEFIKSERGNYFDPQLTDIFIENIDEIENIRTIINESETTENNRIYNYLIELNK